MSSYRKRAAWLGACAVLGAGLLLAFRVLEATPVFNPAASPIGYIAQDDLNTYDLRSGNAVVFRPEYEREYWSGTLFAYPITGRGVIQGISDYWTGDAAQLINAQNFDTGRLIATMNESGTAIPFRWDSLSESQRNYLSSADILNFLRGDRSNEIPLAGKTLRQRASVVGAMIHSRPFYVADDTNPTVFVGANDGMLHAIHAGAAPDGGKERWAYIPSMLMPKMKNISASPYAKDYYVDGQINIATITENASRKRILVGGLGGGGKGLYALDITGSSGLTAATEANVASKVKWEITPTTVNYLSPTTPNAFINLGYTYGNLPIVKVRKSSGAGTAVVDAVIVGNGYNDGVGSYSLCTHASKSYGNCGGDYGSWLYIIDASTGQLISATKAGSGSASSPNGLSTPAVVDTDGDGVADQIYAGDLDGTMWKFVLGTDASVSVSALLVTNPRQAITSNPGIGRHPDGGYMINFGTGRMLSEDDAVDGSVHYVYGVWDGPYPGNTGSVSQTLATRDFYLSGVVDPVKVRQVTTNQQPSWTNGGTSYWKVALPAGERILGERTFIESNRFYFTAFNPTISTQVPNTDTIVKGTNWQMELNYLTGGAANVPFLDMNGDVKIDNEDRIKYEASDNPPGGAAVGSPIMTSAGIPVGLFLRIGVMSQPVLVQMETLNNSLYNQNPDVTVPGVHAERGVIGGHFDVEIYYGRAQRAATATIDVGKNGQADGYPATLGAISVDGVEIVPALTVNELANGTATTTNAAAIQTRVKNGFTATRSNAKITITAPIGTSFNGKSLTIADGTSQAIVQAAASKAPDTTGTLQIQAVPASSSVAISCGATSIIGNFTTSSSTNASTRLNSLSTSISKTVNGYKTTCSATGNPTTALVCTVTAPAGASACPGGFTTSNLTIGTNTGPSGGSNAVAKSGWTNLKPALTVTNFSGAQDMLGNSCINGMQRCTYQRHKHEYDDYYDRSGVNFLDSSEVQYNLSNVIKENNTRFKVLMHNQYLNPAAEIHIGNPNYNYQLRFGYTPVKNFQTSPTSPSDDPSRLDLSTLQTYTMATIGSLAINLPVDAFTPRNWWGGANGLATDVRVGLHPTEADCVFQSASAPNTGNGTPSQDGNMYRPVKPPAAGSSGGGVKGWSSSTTQSTATGVRHNGALTIQVISADTPQNAIEMNWPDHPEYGWRVKADSYATYVIAEYSMFWHTKHLNLCYEDANWTKTPAKDNRTCGSVDNQFFEICDLGTPPVRGTDPKLGDFGSGNGDIVDVIVTTSNNGKTTRTEIYYAGVSLPFIEEKTRNDNGSTTIVRTDTQGVRSEPEIIANTDGSLVPSKGEPKTSVTTGRVSWRELLRF